MIEYTDEFKRRVKAVFPDWSTVHKMVDENNGFLGRVLDDNRSGAINAHLVKRLIREGKEQTLLSIAERELEVEALYSDYWKQPGVKGGAAND